MAGFEVSTEARVFFNDRCGGIVVCTDRACANENRRDTYPSTSAPLVGPEDMVVKTRVDPDPVRGDSTGGWFAVTVAVRNPSPDDVWLQLPDQGNSGTATTFGYVIGQSIRGSNWTNRLRMPFSGGEEQRSIFDVRYNVSLSRGTYLVRGAFSVDTTATTPLTILP